MDATTVGEFHEEIVGLKGRVATIEGHQAELPAVKGSLGQLSGSLENVFSRLTAQETDLEGHDDRLQDLGAVVDALKADGATRQSVDEVRADVEATRRALVDAVDSLRLSIPHNVEDLATRLRAMPEEMDAVRQSESQARQNLKEAKEDYDLAEIEAIATSNGSLEGKNSDERKRKLAAYLTTHPEVQEAKEVMDRAEAELTDASLEVQLVTDRASAVRNEARLAAATLEYLSAK